MCFSQSSVSMCWAGLFDCEEVSLLFIISSGVRLYWGRMRKSPHGRRPGPGHASFLYQHWLVSMDPVDAKRVTSFGSGMVLKGRVLKCPLELWPFLPSSCSWLSDFQRPARLLPGIHSFSFFRSLCWNPVSHHVSLLLQASAYSWLLLCAQCPVAQPHSLTDIGWRNWGTTG